MPREYLRLSGEPEDGDRRKAFESIEGRENLEPFHIEGEYNKDTFKKEWVERVKRVLEHIDFTLLKQLTADITGHSEKLNFLDSNRITLKEMKNDGEDDKYTNGHYSIISNSIEIFPHNLIYSLYLEVLLPFIKKVESSPNGTVTIPFEELVLSDEMVQFGVLRTLIHEQVHAISFTRIVSEHTQGFWKRLSHRIKGKSLTYLSSTLSGYQKNILKKGEGDEYQLNHDFIAFDEGVTDKLAFEILNEYLTAEGSQITTEQQTKFFQKSLQETTYGLCMQLVDQVVKKIAKNVGMDERTVWHALVSSKIEGVDLEDTEIAQFIDESTFEGFFYRLKNLKPNDTRDTEELNTCLKQ